MKKITLLTSSILILLTSGVTQAQKEDRNFSPHDGKTQRRGPQKPTGIDSLLDRPSLRAPIAAPLSATAAFNFQCALDAEECTIYSGESVLDCAGDTESSGLTTKACVESARKVEASCAAMGRDCGIVNIFYRTIWNSGWVGQTSSTSSTTLECATDRDVTNLRVSFAPINGVLYLSHIGIVCSDGASYDAGLNYGSVTYNLSCNTGYFMNGMMLFLDTGNVLTTSAFPRVAAYCGKVNSTQSSGSYATGTVGDSSHGSGYPLNCPIGSHIHGIRVNRDGAGTYTYLQRIRGMRMFCA